MKKFWIILIGSFLTLTKLPAAHDAWRLSHLSIGAGVFDVFPRRTHQFQGQIEYKWAANWVGIQPFVSGFFTSKGSLYFCAGILYDIYLTPRFILTPSFAPGIYFQNGGKRLGFPLEFRSSLALAYQFKNCHRIGAQFYHISNASLGHKNPGAESLIFFWAIPL